MLKRLVVAIVGLVGVVVIALGVASATLWRADDVLVAQLQADEPLVVTDPGVLELAATEVTVRVEADGPVVLAVGRDTDVIGWVGKDPHQRVTGLAGWHELAAQDVAAPTPTPTPTADGSASPAEGDAPAEDEASDGEASDGEASKDEKDATPTVPDPAGSDMWTAEVVGDGEAEITWTAQPGRWSVLAASTDGSPPRLSLAWPQVVTTPWLWPCVVIGALLLMGSGALLVRDVRRGRRGADAGWTPVVTGPLPVVDGSGAPVQLTRRQLRELAEHGAVAGTGVLAPRDDVARADAPHADATAPEQPVPAGTAGTSGRPASEARDEDAATTSAGAVRATAALAGVAPATRRALRAVTSRGSSEREQATSPTPGPAAPPAAATQAGPHPRADRPAWRPTVPPGAPTTSPVPAPDTSSTPAPASGASTTGRPGAPVPAGPAATPAGGRPGGAPRWSVGGGNPSPWASAPTAPGAPDPDPVPASGHDRSPGRPAWLGPAAPSSQPARVSERQLPAPGAPGSPDAPRRPAAPPPGPARTTGQAPTHAPTGPARTGASGDRTVWAPAPPPPGPVAGRVSGPDGPLRSSRTGGSAPAGPGAGPRADATPEAPRPAWLRDAPVPSGPRAGSSPEPPGGSRADAWRRAWGLAATDDDPTPEEDR